jgi:uncharacterized protein YbjT (DUF2867 family)
MTAVVTGATGSLGSALVTELVYVSTTGIYGITGGTPAADDASFAPTNPWENCLMKVLN